MKNTVRCLTQCLCVALVLLGCQRESHTQPQAAPEELEPAPMALPVAPAPISSDTPDAAAPAPAEVEVPTEAVDVPPVPTTSGELPTVAHEPLLPEPAGAPLLVDSSRHRDLFNAIGSHYYPFRWMKDQDHPHQVDVASGELQLPEAYRPYFGLAGEGWSESTALVNAVQHVSKELEQRRRDALVALLTQQHAVTITTDRRELSEIHQRLLTPLLEAGHHIQVLYQLQINADAPELMLALYERGDPLALRVAHRNGAPHCGPLAVGSYCALLPSFPAEEPGHFMWPQGMDQTLLRTIQQEATGEARDPRLSPFTIATMHEDDAVTFIPYAKAGEWQPTMERIALLLEEVAGVEGIDASLSGQLKAQAAAFRSGESYPYDASDAAWIGANSDLELIIGPYRAARDPWKTKAFFLFLLGRVDAEGARIAQTLQSARADWTGKIATLVPTFDATKQAAPLPLRVINTILATGDANGAGGPPASYALPEVGALAEGGQGKRVVLANHLSSAFPLLQAEAKRLLDETSHAHVTASAQLTNIIAHHAFLDLGPGAHYPVLDREGRGSTSGRELGDLFSVLEETKADLLAQWGLPSLEGITAPLTAEALYTTHVAQLLFRLREPAGDTVASLQLAYLLKTGAISVTPASRVQMHMETLAPAYAALLKRVVTLLVEANREQAEAFLAEYEATASEPLERLLTRTAEAGPHHLALYFQVIP